MDDRTTKRWWQASRFPDIVITASPNNASPTGPTHPIQTRYNCCLVIHQGSDHDHAPMDTLSVCYLGVNGMGWEKGKKHDDRFARVYIENYDEIPHSPFDFFADPSYTLLLGAPLMGLTCEADWK
jgi:hypothetical protein